MTTHMTTQHEHAEQLQAIVRETRLRHKTRAEAYSDGYAVIAAHPGTAWPDIESRVRKAVRRQSRREDGDVGEVAATRDTLAAVDAADLIAAAWPRLTERQRKVAAWLRDGWKQGDMASALDVDQKTVSRDVAAIRAVFAALLPD